MSTQEFSGIITNIQATSAHVKVQIDTVPGKTFVWGMTMFVSKPRPEVGKRIVCTARPGPHDEFHVQGLISITDALPAQESVSRPLPTMLPVAEATSTIEQLAERILELKGKCKQAFAQGLLDFKWEVGREISGHRGDQGSETFRVLAEKTGIAHSDLVCCVQFYRKFPSKGYELKAWRELRAELPEKAGAAERPALVVDEKHLWVCPECGQKFDHVHVSENKHRLREVGDE